MLILDTDHIPPDQRGTPRAAGLLQQRLAASPEAYGIRIIVAGYNVVDGRNLPRQRPAPADRRLRSIAKALSILRHMERSCHGTKRQRPNLIHCVNRKRESELWTSEIAAICLAHERCLIESKKHKRCFR